MLNLLVSTVVFAIAAFFLRRYLADQGLDKGMVRSVLVFLLASLVSYGAGAATDWVADRLAPPAHRTAKTGDFQHLLNTLGAPNAHD